MAPPEPKLDEAAAAFVTAKAMFVVIGGFAVIANRFVRAEPLLASRPTTSKPL